MIAAGQIVKFTLASKLDGEHLLCTFEGRAHERHVPGWWNRSRLINSLLKRPNRAIYWLVDVTRFVRGRHGPLIVPENPSGEFSQFADSIKIAIGQLLDGRIPIAEVILENELVQYWDARWVKSTSLQPDRVS